jgi:hypothetical protein
VAGNTRGDSDDTTQDAKSMVHQRASWPDSQDFRSSEYSPFNKLRRRGDPGSLARLGRKP